MYLMSKFDVNELPTNMPCYYVNAIKEWSRLSSLSVEDVDNISAQPLWYKREIKIGFKTVYNENLFSIGMWYVGGLFDEENLLSFDTWVRRGANEADRLAWYGIVNCIYKSGTFITCVIIHQNWANHIVMWFKCNNCICERRKYDSKTC